MFFIFVVSLICFPGVMDTTNLRFLENVNQAESWFELLMQIVYNMGDAIGRVMGGAECLRLSVKATVFNSYLRTFFIATYFLIMFNVKPDWLFGADWFKIFNSVMFGITNGYLSTLCAILGPSVVADNLKQETASFISFVIVSGITFGAALAIPVGMICQIAPKNQDN
jgi:solute carrier family 29 (equilibrative nucleoside transporter), member 1/2/3